MPRTDFDGDGRDDIIWQNSLSGSVMNWRGQADGSFLYNESAGMDPWAIGDLVGIGDFNADGRSDTLWKTSRGEVFLSETFQDGAFYFTWSLGFVAKVPTSSSVAGVGDFNGDGRDDIIWRSSTGVASLWLAKDSYVFANAQVNGGQAISLGWKVAGIADFNGDGKDDLLWRHDNGMITTWLGQVGGFRDNSAKAGQWVSNELKIAGVGDFNGDGHADLLWRGGAGSIATWLGDASGGFLGKKLDGGQPIADEWQIVGTGDYNGDGHDDILLRREDGTITNWLGQDDGRFASNAEHSYYSVDLVWQMPGHAHFSGQAQWDY